ncbi:hypothetical protein BDR26DRAFT_852526, partial [Obelidium mucronatum]
MPNKRKQPDAEARRAERNRHHQKIFREKRNAKIQLLEERVVELERELKLAAPTAVDTPSSITCRADITQRAAVDPSLEPREEDSAHVRLIQLEAENEALREALRRETISGQHISDFNVIEPRGSDCDDGESTLFRKISHTCRETSTYAWEDLLNLSEDSDSDAAVERKPQDTVPIVTGFVLIRVWGFVP